MVKLLIQTQCLGWSAKSRSVIIWENLINWHGKKNILNHFHSCLWANPRGRIRSVTMQDLVVVLFRYRWKWAWMGFVIWWDWRVHWLGRSFVVTSCLCTIRHNRPYKEFTNLTAQQVPSVICSVTWLDTGFMAVFDLGPSLLFKRLPSIYKLSYIKVLWHIFLWIKCLLKYNSL